MTPFDIEKLRLELISFGMTRVMGTAYGSGDSADEYTISAGTMNTQDGFVRAELPAATQERLNDFLDHIVDSYPEWDFNNEGSHGEIEWELASGDLVIDARYYVSDSVDFGTDSNTIEDMAEEEDV